eukprot:GABV01000172.1.p2 GENE.GABV01000172.1~~GABV01000172.1.p2  ORF type:complete len:200 (-),score=60.78 GABV01000172.1:24-623(-)
MSLSLVILVSLLHQEVKINEKFGKWMRQHLTVVYIVTFFSITNLDVLNILGSHIFNKRVFDAPWSFQARTRIPLYGLVSNIFEDFPQIVIQIAFLVQAESGETTFFALAALVSSVLSLMFGAGRKLLVHFLEKFAAVEDGAQEASTKTPVSPPPATSAVSGSLKGSPATTTEVNVEMHPAATVVGDEEQIEMIDDQPDE